MDELHRNQRDTSTEDGLMGPVDAAVALSGGRARRRWVMPLRIAVSGVMLAYLIHKLAGVPVEDMIPEWSTATGLWLTLAFVLTVGGVVLSAARWSQVLAAMEVHAAFHRLVSWYFAAQFVSNVLPTTIGGDVLRVGRLTRDCGDSASSFASVTIERLTGWLVLPLLTLTGFVLSPGLMGASDRSPVALLIAAGTLAVLLVILTAAYHPKLGGRYAGSDGWRRFLGAVHLGVDALRRRPSHAAGLVGVGLSYQLVLVVGAYAAAQGIGMSVGPSALLAYYPAVMIAQVLPVGVAGLGVREGMFVFFLTPLGVPAEQAIALGLTVFALNLAASLPGAPAFLASPPDRTITDQPIAAI